MKLWPEQVTHIGLIREAIKQGHRRIAVEGATGSGKTVEMAEIAKSAVEKGKRVVLFCQRKVQRSQAYKQFEDHGVDDLGVIAYGSKADLDASTQIVMQQTATSWTQGTFEMPPADIVMVDEAHMNRGPTMQTIYNHYTDAIILMFTATPVGLRDFADVLVRGPSKAVLREPTLHRRQVLVPGLVFSPEEYDLRRLKMIAGEYSDKAAGQRIRDCHVIGNIIQHWERLNPSFMGRRAPTVVFTPTVDTSKDVMAEFAHEGHTAAHIDGTTPWRERDELFEKFTEGDVQVLCSCDTLRESWDCPAACHGILLKPCGALHTLIQIVGRLMRYTDGKSNYVLQDHSGAIRRHCIHPDDDIEWNLNDDASSINKKRKQSLQSGTASEPICCPKCGCERMGVGDPCPSCGHVSEKSLRRVRQIGGELKLVRGQVTKRKKPQTDETRWRSSLIRSAMSDMNVGQAIGMHNNIHGCWPPDDGLCFEDGNKPVKVRDAYPWTNRIVESALRRRL